MLPDALHALMLYLKGQPALTALVEERIYGLEFPASGLAEMPRHALLLRWAGGLGINLPLALTSRRVDVWHYGITAYEAERLWRTTYPLLKHLSRQVWAQTLLHSVTEASGPIPLVGPETRWPTVVQSWSVVHDDRILA